MKNKLAISLTFLGIVSIIGITKGCGDFGFMDEGVCKPCIDHCRKCESRNSCRECESEKYRYNSDLNICEYCTEENCLDCEYRLSKDYYTVAYCNKCETGYYTKESGKDFGKCLLCERPNCAKCGSESCELCDDGYTKMDGSNCTRWADSPCCNNCAECNVGDQECTKCHPGYYLTNTHNCDPCPIVAHCVACSINGCIACEEGMEVIGGKCRPILEHCEDRYETTDNCLRCDEGYNRAIDGLCTKDISVNGCAIVSNQHCYRCDGTHFDLFREEKYEEYIVENSIIKCITNCPEEGMGLMLRDYSLPTVICLDKCPPYYYVEASSHYCKPCSEVITWDKNCAECKEGESGMVCTKCKPGHIMDNKFCRIPCIRGCKICTISHQYSCKECMEGYFKTGDGRCSQCVDRCAQCTNSYTCTICLHPAYHTPDDQCLSCPDLCLECPNGSDNCSTCQVGYYAHYGHCDRCDYSCDVCVADSYYCRKCIFPLIMYISKRHYDPELPLQGECLRYIPSWSKRVNGTIQGMEVRVYIDDDDPTWCPDGFEDNGHLWCVQQKKGFPDAQTLKLRAFPQTIQYSTIINSWSEANLYSCYIHYIFINIIFGFILYLGSGPMYTYPLFSYTNKSWYFNYNYFIVQSLILILFNSEFILFVHKKFYPFLVYFVLGSHWIILDYLFIVFDLDLYNIHWMVLMIPSYQENREVCLYARGEAAKQLYCFNRSKLVWVGVTNSLQCNQMNNTELGVI